MINLQIYTFYLTVNVVDIYLYLHILRFLIVK
jgi:hypothetical protein